MDFKMVAFLVKSCFILEEAFVLKGIKVCLKVHFFSDWNYALFFDSFIDYCF